jgi:hypothetical protein
MAAGDRSRPAVALFSARPHQQIDLDTLTAELLAVVEETMLPTRRRCGCGRNPGRNGTRRWLSNGL